MIIPLEPDEPRRSGTIAGTRLGPIGNLAGMPWTRFLYWIVLLAAALVDASTFYQVIAIVMKEVEEQVIWTVVVGFTLLAIALAHLAGSQARHRVERHFSAFSSISGWIMFGVWLAMGLAAFLVRYIAPGASTYEYSDSGGFSASGGDTTLPALMFLTLYLATGAVAGMGGYTRPNPAIKQYRRAIKAEARAARQVAKRKHDLKSAEGLATQLENMKDKRDGPLAAAANECSAAATRLKGEASLLIEALRRRGYRP